MFHDRGRTTIRLLTCLAAVAALGVTACGDDGDDDEATDATDAPAASGDETAAPDGAAGEVLEVAAVDYAFEDLPASVPAGTQLSLVNDSQAELHELVAVRLPDGETRSAEELVVLPDEEADALLGGAPPATVIVTEPGGEPIYAVGDGTLAEPGRYLLLCAIPTGVDPAEYMAAAEAGGEGPPQIEGAGPPHLVHGMYADLTVE